MKSTQVVLNKSEKISLVQTSANFICTILPFIYLDFLRSGLFYWFVEFEAIKLTTLLNLKQVKLPPTIYENFQYALALQQFSFFQSRKIERFWLLSKFFRNICTLFGGFWNIFEIEEYKCTQHHLNLINFREFYYLWNILKPMKIESSTSTYLAYPSEQMARNLRNLKYHGRV